jgi:hypothetical protein
VVMCLIAFVRILSFRTGFPENRILPSTISVNVQLTCLCFQPHDMIAVFLDNIFINGFIARPDQGHRYTLLEVPGLTCPGRARTQASRLGSEHSRIKSHLDSLYAGYSEPLLMMRLLYPDLYMAPPVQVHRTWTTECRRYA